MTSQLGEMCRSLMAISDDIDKMSRVLIDMASRIRQAASEAKHMESRARLLHIAGANTSSALYDAAQKCIKAASVLSSARQVSATYVQQHWIGISGSTSGTQESSRSVGQSVESDGRGTLSDAQALVLDHEYRTSVGSAFFVTDSDLLAAVCLPPYFDSSDRQEYVLHIHGAPDIVAVGDEHLGASEFGRVVRCTDWAIDKKPIRLFSCSTGRDPNGFAQQLANELRVPVTAPTTLAWSPSLEFNTIEDLKEGRMPEPVISDAVLKRDDVTGGVRRVPKLPETGTWKVFYPS